MYLDQCGESEDIRFYFVSKFINFQVFQLYVSTSSPAIAESRLCPCGTLMCCNINLIIITIIET